MDALPITARILTLIPDYDSVIFSEYMYYRIASKMSCGLAFRKVAAW
jgi:hypothetical protein